MHLNNLSGAATSQISWSFPKGNQDYESLIAKFSQVESNISLLQISTNSVEESYRKMCKTIEELNDEKGTHDKKIKKIHQKLQSMEKHNESLANQNEDIGAKLDVRIEEVMHELHTASEFMTGLQKQNEKLVNQMNASKKQVTDLTNNFQNSQIQQTDLIKQIEERLQTKAIEDDNVNKKIKDITEKVTVMDERCSKLNDQLEILSDKIKESEKNDSVVSIYNEKLTTLQQGLNEQVQRLNTIDDNMKMKEESDKLKLTEIQNRFEAAEALNNEVASINSEITAMSKAKDDLLRRIEELETTDDIVAFSARVAGCGGTFDLEAGQIMTCFKSITIDYNNVFDSKTGIFTAPVGGIYMCSLVIDVDTDQTIIFKICQNSDKESVRGTSHTGIKNAIVCDNSLAHLNKNDQVYVKPCSTHPKINFSHYSHFLCILIQKD